MPSKENYRRASVFEETASFYLTLHSLYEQSGYYKNYPLTYLWGRQNMKELLDIIHGESDPVAKISAVHNTFMFSVNTPDEDIKNRMIDWYIDYFQSLKINLQNLDPAIQESSYSNPRNSVLRDGRLLAPDFLRTVAICLEIRKHCKLPDGKFTVLELGAGYGGLARTLKLFHPGMSHVIIDIPETLYFSSTFLRLNFPTAKFCYVTDPSCLTEPVNEYDFIFVPTIFAEALKGNEFKLFCNTASLGEMKNQVIRYWMDFVQNKVGVKYFFGLNRLLNTIDPHVHSFRLDENRCSVSFDRDWRILQWELEPPFTRCPYLETEVTRNLEVIAERLPKGYTHEDECKMASRKLVEKVARQDWFIHYNADNTMKLRDNILAPDLTMKGALFALWESIRLHPNAANVAMMLKYLNTLTREKPFEEMFYYQDFLNFLTNGSLDPEQFQTSLTRPFSIWSSAYRIIPPAIKRAIPRLVRRLYYGSLIS